MALTVDTPSAVDRLLASWNAYGGRTDSKYDAFEEALRKFFVAGADRVLVFSYFTGTIDYLADRLASLDLDGAPLRVVKLYGPMSAEQRDEAVTDFRSDKGPIVMLSSEVGSEGLDFQFCSRMFNYDLPWNPMRVEQRIGRLDRYGQESELIHIVNMVVSETIEERIFYRLYERIRIFEDSIGDLDAILGERDYTLGQLQRDALSGRLTDAELDRRRNQVGDVILRRKQENDVFEEQSRQFLSNDDVFVDLFQDISKSRRYITPEQLQLLVARYLSVSGTQARLEPGPSGSEKVRLTGNVGALRVQLARALSRDAIGARAGRHFLTRLADDGLELTFDPAVAMRNRSLEFVSFHHPLIRTLAAEPAMRADAAPCGALAVDAGLPPGARCVFFIFEIEAHGLKDSLELAALVVHPDGAEVPGAGAALLGALDSAVTYTGVRPEIDVDRLRATSLDWISREVATRERELQARNDETVSAQIESLRLSTSRRRLWLAEQVENSRSESIRRMHRSQLARQESEHAARLERLEDGRLISIGHRLIATGVVAAKTT